MVSTVISPGPGTEPPLSELVSPSDSEVSSRNSILSEPIKFLSWISEVLLSAIGFIFYAKFIPTFFFQKIIN